MTNQPQTIHPTPRLHGSLTPPGDKSLSHRAVIFNSVAEGTAVVSHFLPGADCLATVAIMQQLGVQIEQQEAADGSLTLTVHGVGREGLREAEGVLDAQNSGTTTRLLCGLLAGQPFYSVLTGDPSLSRRPMARVAEPLRAMGAQISGRQGGRLLPLSIVGRRPLQAASYRLPVASAQVKSAILLAGLYAEGANVLSGKVGSRDHSERLLRAMGVPLTSSASPTGEEGEIRMVGGASLRATDVAVPGDFSTAAFWLVAGAIHPNAEISLRGVNLNPTRTGLLDVLREMGAEIVVSNEQEQAGEPIGDLLVRSSKLRGVTVEGAIIPRLIDEVPILALAAACAVGPTTIRDAGEMRVKESDRITAVSRGLGKLGVQVSELPDGMIISGGAKLRGADLQTYGDHRLAMTFAIAAGLAEGDSTLDDPACVAVSYPSFWQDYATLAGR